MKNKVFIGLITVLVLCLGVAFINVKADDNIEYKRGDLRCPTEKEENVTCIEHKDSNGVVTSVDLVYGSLEKDGDIQITKTVSKIPDNLGHYNVQFNVKGQNVSQLAKPEKVYVAIILDYSNTIKQNIPQVEAAAREFAKTLIPNSENGNSNFYIKLIQFSSNTSVPRKGYVNKNLKGVGFSTYDSLGAYTSREGKWGKYFQSYIDKAFAEVKFPSDSNNKFIFVFGDGRYWYKWDTNVDSAIKKSDNFKKNGVKIYGLRYNGSNLGASTNSCKNYVPGRTYAECDELMMKRLVSKYYNAGSNSSKLSEKFKQIADEIKSQAGNSSTSFSAQLTDNIGDDFYLTDDTGSYQNFTIDELSLKGTTVPTKPFEIEIDQHAKGNLPNGAGWHETNNNFYLTYTDENGIDKTIDVKLNPEVYWIPFDENLHSCSSTSTAGTIRDDGGSSNDFYTISCKEGYMENNVTRDGFKTEATINGLPVGVGSFQIVSGLGFTSKLKFSTNVVCTYNFKSSTFVEQYNDLKNSLTSNDPHVLASATKRLQKMDTSLKNYQNLNTKQDLLDYAERFTNQSATMTIAYKNSNATDVFNYENTKSTTLNDNLANVSCVDNKVETINGKRIVTSKTCHASFSKEMQLANTCLNMQTGEQKNCTVNSKNQISGGNKAYTSLKETGGYVTIKIPNAGYKQNLDIELKKNDDKGKAECEFSSTNKKIDFRQIDLNDPFLKKYNDRQVGRNYANDQFNFEKIIHPDTWDNEAEYDYLMSKTNINNINRDTNEEPAKSYLGRNCYFRSDGKYVCEFTRIGQSGETTDDKKFFYGLPKINVD